MLKSLKEFFNENITTRIQCNITEGTHNKDITCTLDNMEEFFTKRGIYIIRCEEVVKVDDVPSTAVIAFNKSNKGCAFVWDRLKTDAISRILFIDDFKNFYNDFCNGNPVKTNICIKLRGASSDRIKQFVSDMMRSGSTFDKEFIHQYINNNNIVESSDPIIADLEKKKTNLYQQIKMASRRGEDITVLNKEYDAAKNDLDLARSTVKENVLVVPAIDKTLETMQTRFENDKNACPGIKKDAAKDAVANVVNGTSNSAILCGRPDMDKLTPVLLYLKQRGLRESIDYLVLNGDATPARLYSKLFEYRGEGKILIINNATSVLKESSSLSRLKDAVRHQKDRIISYGSTNNPPSNLPGEFSYSGGLIIISDYKEEDINGMLTYKSETVDFSHSADCLLDIVKSLAPYIMPESLCICIKDKSIGLMDELISKGVNIPINMMTLSLIARLYNTAGATDDTVKIVAEEIFS